MDAEVFGMLGAFGCGENERWDSKGSADVNVECPDVTPGPGGRRCADADERSGAGGVEKNLQSTFDSAWYQLIPCDHEKGEAWQRR